MEKTTMSVQKLSAQMGISLPKAYELVKEPGLPKLRRLAEYNLGVFSVYSGNRYLIVKPKFEEFILNSSEI